MWGWRTYRGLSDSDGNICAVASSSNTDPGPTNVNARTAHSNPYTNSRNIHSYPYIAEPNLSATHRDTDPFPAHFTFPEALREASKSSFQEGFIPNWVSHNPDKPEPKRIKR